MTVPVAGAREMSELVSDLAGRISRLERSGNVAHDDDGRALFPSGIDTGDSGDVGPGGTPDPPTDLVLTAGALFDEVYVDVDWTAPADDTHLAAYEIRVDKVTDPGDPGETSEVIDVLVVPIVTGTRIRSLEPNTTYDVHVYSRNVNGTVSAPLTGRVTTGADNTDPSQVSGLTVTAGLRSIIAEWDETADGDVVDGHGVYELQLDTVDTFDTGNLRTTRVGGTIGGFTDLTTDVEYHVRVRAIDSSGNSGPWSATGSATTSTVANADLGAGVVDTANIVDAAILEAKIGDAEITDAKIVSASVSKLTAGNLTVTATLTSGAIYVGSGPGATGLYIDSAGLRAYDGATRTVFIDAATGDAEFIGTITATAGEVSGTLTVTGKLRSASSGARIEIGENAYSHPSISPGDAINVYDSDDALSSPTGRIWAAGNNLDVSTKGSFIVWDDDVLAPMLEVDVPAGETTLQTDLIILGGGIDVSGTIHGDGAITSGSVVRSADGTASVPGHGFVDDIDTGMFRSAANDLSFTAGGGTRTATLDGSTDPGFRPGADNQANLGDPSFRWVDVYAVSGSVNSSDVDLKREVEPGDLGLEFLLEVGTARWKFRDGRRPHYGPVAQDVKRVLDERGIDFAGFVDPTVEIDRMEAECPYEDGGRWADDPDADVECAAWHARLDEKRGQVHLGLRHHEFIGPIITALGELEERLSAVETSRP